MSKKAFNKTSQRDKQRSEMPTENKHEVFASIAIEAIKNIAEVYKHGQIHPSKTTTTYSSKSSAQTSDTCATASSDQRVEKEGSCSSGKGKSQTIEKATIAAVALAAGIFGTAWIYKQEQTRRKAKGGNAEGEGNEGDDEDNEDLKEERIPHLPQQIVTKPVQKPRSLLHCCSFFLALLVHFFHLPYALLSMLPFDCLACASNYSLL